MDNKVQQLMMWEVQNRISKQDFKAIFKQSVGVFKVDSAKIWHVAQMCNGKQGTANDIKYLKQAF